MVDRISAKVQGLERLRNKVLQRLPTEARAKLDAANSRNADEFLARVAIVVTKGDPKDGNLVDTLKKEKSDRSETGYAVSIGGPDQPHPMHLEGGHRAPDGSHVPGKPYWNPTKRVMKKRARARNARAASAAIKAAVT